MEIFILRGLTAIENVNWDTIKIPENPLIHSNEIISYDWNTHKITVNDTAKKRIKDSINMEALSGRWGIPFVITINRKPIYGGYFWTMKYAVGTMAPVILLENLNKDVLRINLELGIKYGQSDPRERAEIFNYLKRKKLLIVKDSLSNKVPVK